MSSNDICQACMLVDKLNDMGKPKLELQLETASETQGLTPI